MGKRLMNTEPHGYVAPVPLGMHHGVVARRHEATLTVSVEMIETRDLSLIAQRLDIKLLE